MSVQAKSKTVFAAAVVKVSPDQVNLQLLKPDETGVFQKEGQVQIKYWIEEIVYSWEAVLLEISENRFLRASARGLGVTVQQRKFLRFAVSIPFSFTIVDSSSAELAGETILNSKTKDISVGGLRFETQVPLQKGDKLDMKLRVSRVKYVNALGWVVRTNHLEQKGGSSRSVGVQFLQLQDEEQKQLSEFLSQVESS